MCARVCVWKGRDAPHRIDISAEREQELDSQARQLMEFVSIDAFGVCL